MLSGRSVELKQLSHYYDREGSQIVVVYGQENNGKKALIRAFTEEKPVCMYAARSCSEREQAYEWGAELFTLGIRVSKYPSYGEIFSAVTEKRTEKLVLVVEEFQNMIKGGPAFMKELVSFVHEHGETRQVLVLLCSASVGWVENSMIKKIGEAAYALSGLLKIKELKFKDCEAYFTGFDKRQCMEVYATLGGVPGLWTHFNDKLSVKENIIRTMLSPSGSLYKAGEKYLLEELRETAVYNTILASIAGGMHKLNDLYLHTGFSRAKISVYLKSLMELEIVEKVFSYDTEGHENAQKGVYRISNRFLHFYYRFIYPHMSSLLTGTPQGFYEAFIEPEYKAYVAEYFKQVCRQDLEEQNEEGLLPYRYDKIGEWVGKAGTIDVIMQDEEAHCLIAGCDYESPVMSYESYERLLFLAGRARLLPEHIRLYSAGRFDERLKLEAKVKKNITLISLEDL